MTVNRNWLAPLGLALWSMTGMTAWAAPPFLTDDPEPVELHHFEVYLAGTYSGYKAGYFSTLPQFEINYGPAKNLQISLTSQMVIANPTGGTTQYGYGDTLVGAKYRFIQETRSSPQVSIYPQMTLPTGDLARGLGQGQSTFFLPIWMQKSFGPWTAIGGGGYWSNPGIGNRNYWYTGVLLQRQVTKRLNLGGEFFYISAQTFGGVSQAGINFGGTYDFDEIHHLLFSAGNDVYGSGKGLAYLGYGWTWGPKEAGPEKP